MSTITCDLLSTAARKERDIVWDDLDNFLKKDLLNVGYNVNPEADYPLLARVDSLWDTSMLTVKNVDLFLEQEQRYDGLDLNSCVIGENPSLGALPCYKPKEDVLSQAALDLPYLSIESTCLFSSLKNGVENEKYNEYQSQQKLSPQSSSSNNFVPYSKVYNIFLIFLPSSLFFLCHISSLYVLRSSLSIVSIFLFLRFFTFVEFFSQHSLFLS